MNYYNDKQKRTLFFICLFFNVLLAPQFLIGQDTGKYKVVTIDPVTRQLDQPFPFDEHFSLIYKIDKELEVASIQYMQVKNKSRQLLSDYVILKPIKFHIKEAKEKEEKHTLTLLMRPLPPGKLWDILIEYKKHPKIVSQMEELANTYSQTSEEMKIEINTYVGIEKALKEVAYTETHHIMNNDQVDLLRIPLYIIGLEEAERVPIIDEIFNNKVKEYEELKKKSLEEISKRIKKLKKKNGGNNNQSKINSAKQDSANIEKEYRLKDSIYTNSEVKKYFRTVSNQALAFLVKLNNIINSGYVIKNRTNEFPNVEKIVRILNDHQPHLYGTDQLSHYFQTIRSFNNCKSQIAILLNKNVKIKKSNQLIIDQLMTIQDSMALDSLIKGFYPLLRPKKKKKDFSIKTRIKNLEDTKLRFMRLIADLEELNVKKTTLCGKKYLHLLLKDLDEIFEKIQSINTFLLREFRLNYHFTIIDTISNCCDILVKALKQDSLIYQNNRQTISRLNELINQPAFNLIMNGYYPFLKHKNRKKAATYSARIENLDKTSNLLWQLIEDFQKIKGCELLYCKKNSLLSLINRLDQINLEVISTKNGLKGALSSLSFNYFDWIDGHTNSSSYKTTVTNILKPDIGVAWIFSNYEKTVRPYYGVSINFRSVNNHNRFRDVAQASDFVKKNWSNWLLYHLSVDIGASLGSIAIADTRDDLYSKANLLTGLSLRIPKTGIRVNGGLVLYKKVNPNPLLDDTDLAVLPYASVKFDFVIKEAIPKVTSLFFK